MCCLTLQITEKVFAKGGLNLTESSISTNRSECFFHETKLIKKCEVEKQARLNATDISIKYSTPPFANTLLAEGVVLSVLDFQDYIFKILVFKISFMYSKI